MATRKRKRDIGLDKKRIEKAANVCNAIIGAKSRPDAAVRDEQVRRGKKGEKGRGGREGKKGTTEKKGGKKIVCRGSVSRKEIAESMQGKKEKKK